MPSSDGERERESGGERQIKRREDPGVWESEGCETPTDRPTPFVFVFFGAAPQECLGEVLVLSWNRVTLFTRKGRRPLIEFARVSRLLCCGTTSAARPDARPWRLVFLTLKITPLLLSHLSTSLKWSEAGFELDRRPWRQSSRKYVEYCCVWETRRALPVLFGAGDQEDN